MRFKDIRQHKRLPEVVISTERDRFGNLSVVATRGCESQRMDHVNENGVEKAAAILRRSFR